MFDLSGAVRQRQIYLDGFAGKLPKVPVDFQALEQAALRTIDPRAAAYIVGGAGAGNTMLSNRKAFDRYQITPRMLNDVSKRDLSIELFGQKLTSPLLLAPIGVAEMAHKDADVAIGKAAASLNVPYIFSNQASKPMEEVAAVMHDSMRWFQLYWSKSNELVASFVARAEKCGCKAIVVTLDTTLLGWRTKDLDVAYLPFLEGKGIAQYTSDPVFQKLMDEHTAATSRKVTIHSLLGLIEMVKHYPGNGFIKKLSSGKPVKAV